MSKQTDKIAEYSHVLRQADIFYDLTDDQLDMVSALCTEIVPQTNEIIFEENSRGDELYVVANGAVDILVNPTLVQSSANRQSTEPLTIATVRRGQTFGEISLVDQGLRSAAARCAARKTRLLLLPRDGLIQLCDQYPDLGYRLMRNIAADLAFKIRGTDMAIREKLLWRPRVEQ